MKETGILDAATIVALSQLRMRYSVAEPVVLPSVPAHQAIRMESAPLHSFAVSVSGITMGPNGNPVAQRLVQIFRRETLSEQRLVAHLVVEDHSIPFAAICAQVCRAFDVEFMTRPPGEPARGW